MIYDKFAKNYDKVFASFNNRFLDKWREETLSYLPPKTRILEIGAGTGANFKFYPKSECAVAFDISLQMLNFGESKIENRKIELVQANAESLPFPDNFFDAAFATLVFCSIPKPENAFRELQRVLQPGGKIILLEHIRPKNVFGYVFDLLNILTVALIEDHFNRKIAEIAENCGFEVLEVKEKAFGAVNLIVCQNN